jgi:hypothetical protein
MAVGIELRHQHHGDAEEEGRENAHQRGVQIHRRRNQRDCIRAIAIDAAARKLPRGVMTITITSLNDRAFRVKYRAGQL